MPIYNRVLCGHHSKVRPPVSSKSHPNNGCGIQDLRGMRQQTTHVSNFRPRKFPSLSAAVTFAILCSGGFSFFFFFFFSFLFFPPPPLPFSLSFSCSCLSPSPFSLLECLRVPRDTFNAVERSSMNIKYHCSCRETGRLTWKNLC